MEVDRYIQHSHSTATLFPSVFPSPLLCKIHSEDSYPRRSDSSVTVDMDVYPTIPREACIQSCILRLKKKSKRKEIRIIQECERVVKH
jgi:hypothetical protein